MGAKQTKVEEICKDDPGEMHAHQPKAIELEAMHIETQQYVQKETPPRAVDTLRRRFFKGFTYNLNDPRSPSIWNRTPLVFDDKNDKTLNLDDTFADLFVDSQKDSQVKAPNKDIMGIIDGENTETPAALIGFNAYKKSLSSSDAENESTSVEFSSLIEEETMPCSAVLKPTPPIFQQALDPRSPTIGLTRTPIVFDDDEAQEDAMLEDILATLSLDFSDANSSNSFGTATTTPLSVVSKKPVNKHLDRVRAMKKPEKPIRKTKYTVAQKQRIYLDSENANVTPKRKINMVADSEKRTPLSCVKNKVHLRSRSVEPNGKSPKPRLSLTSYDDSLNPAQDRKIVNLHAMQGDAFDL